MGQIVGIDGKVMTVGDAEVCTEVARGVVAAFAPEGISEEQAKVVCEQIGALLWMGFRAARSASDTDIGGGDGGGGGEVGGQEGGS